MTARYGTTGLVIGAAFGGLTGHALGPWLLLGALGAVMGSVLGSLIGRAIELEHHHPHS